MVQRLTQLRTLRQPGGLHAAERDRAAIEANVSSCLSLDRLSWSSLVGVSAQRWVADTGAFCGLSALSSRQENRSTNSHCPGPLRARQRSAQRYGSFLVRFAAQENEGNGRQAAIRHEFALPGSVDP